MTREFVVISGLPGSGKSALAEQLSSVLDLPIIDKDSILESIFDAKGTGDAAWRRTLSRGSDRIFQAKARASNGAILVSFWHQPGMDPDSGTPTAWLSELTNRIVNVHCVCPPEIAASRFFHRQRHPGHLDNSRSYEEILSRSRVIAALGSIPFEERIEIDTSKDLGIEALAREIRRVLRG